ncbi:NAD(P)/FAD-dependent oxidoreductase [Nocardia sp. NBC_00565]|uniref:flavin-containing monooxygenase n=1 Tax=Nocardia sp. NBC_00565 TaxID=2975993 RepID=UPI002E81131C|nr:NAD(P)/FAD-dependent oxidoreductase [Nocardia sp. NBC_00565]WUC06599.1 NAD(P)/FAD-dependent oxidoreductase [Nocardia sp. NBC_00565]
MEETTRDAFASAVQDESALRAALLDADAVTSLMVLAHLSGDSTLLERAQEYITGPSPDGRRVPRSLHEEAVEQLIGVLRDLARGGSIPDLAESELHKIMNIGAGEEVPHEYVPMGLSENHLDIEHKYRQPFAWTKDPADLLRDFSVVVIGCGVSGIAAGVRLREAGIPFVILDKNEAPGGTWWENKYPGCGLDTPSDTYQYTFYPNKSTTGPYIKRNEVLAYLQSTIAAHGLEEFIVSGAKVSKAEFLEDKKRWQVEYTKDGVEHALTPNIVISAVGALNNAKVPAFEGLEEYSGEVLHTAQWNEEADLTGRRVAMIGIGASGMQTGPTIAPIVEHLRVFQRSPHWSAPDPAYHEHRTPGEIWAAENVPYFASWRRFLVMWAGFDRAWPMMHSDSPEIEALRGMLTTFIEHELKDRPDLRAAVTPDFLPFTKRMLYYNNWFPMLRRENVSLVTSPIERFTNRGILTADGVEHDVDVTIFATGFDMTQMLGSYEVIGRDGVTVRELWADNDPRAYLGAAIPHLPNFFTLFGPNSALAHGGSFVFVAECQLNYLLQAIRVLLEEGYTSVECQQSVHDEYNKRLDDQNSRMVWSNVKVNNWYRNAAGRVTSTLPWRLVDYWNMTKTFEPSEYNWTR